MTKKVKGPAGLNSEAIKQLHETPDTKANEQLADIRNKMGGVTYLMSMVPSNSFSAAGISPRRPAR